VRRVVVITENALIVPPIRAGLRANGAFELLAYGSPLRASAARISETGADVVLVDECEDRESTLGVIRAINERDESICIVVLAVRMDGDWLKRALEAGASVAISKVVHPAALATLMREATEGHLVHSPRVLAAGGEVPVAQCADDSPLTDRELEILRLVASGGTNGQIARALWITQQTVKFHLSNIYRKLDLTNRTEACHYAHVAGLIAPAQELQEAASLSTVS
jgi:DNA-binding NarL/FixJ family response regulator